jgi:hypothetical protein
MDCEANTQPANVAEESPSTPAMPHDEKHYSHRSPWLRAAVLGACDGVVTVGALITGIASANVSQKQLLVSACAGTMAGASCSSESHQDVVLRTASLGDLSSMSDQFEASLLSNLTWCRLNHTRDLVHTSSMKLLALT